STHDGQLPDAVRLRPRTPSAAPSATGTRSARNEQRARRPPPQTRGPRKERRPPEAQEIRRYRSPREKRETEGTEKIFGSADASRNVSVCIGRPKKSSAPSSSSSLRPRRPVSSL